MNAMGEYGTPSCDCDDCRACEESGRASSHSSNVAERATENFEHATDDEFGITLDPCEHPSINGDVCAVCNEQVHIDPPSVSPLPASGESTGSLPPPTPGAPSQETTR